MIFARVFLFLRHAVQHSYHSYPRKYYHIFCSKGNFINLLQLTDQHENEFLLVKYQFAEQYNALEYVELHGIHMDELPFHIPNSL